MGSEDEGFSCRMHFADGKLLLAVCDACLLGKKIKHKDIDFKVSDSFYGGGRPDVNELLEDIRRADIVNVVGKGIVELLVKKGLVDEECILWMGDTPHVQIVRL